MASVVSHDFRGADVLERNSENDFQEQFLDDQGSQSDTYPPSQIYEHQLDVYTGNENTHQSHRVRGRSKKDLCKWFSIPVTECLLDEFYCAYRKKVLLQGRMFVFEHYICFNSSVFGYIKRRVIPFADLKHMRKKTYFHIPNTIEMEDVNGSKDFFTSFLSRDDAFNLIYKTWEKQRNPSLAENGETSPDGHHRRTSNGSGGESLDASSQDARKKYSSLMNQDNLTEVESVSSSNAQELRSLGTSHPGDDDFNEKDLNDDPNSPKAPLMAAVDHLWIPQSTPAPTDGRGKHLVHARIPGTPRDFFDAVLRDGSTFLEEFLGSQGNRQLVMSRWRPHEQLGFVRDLQFIAPIKGAFSNWGAAQTQCYQSHRFAVYDIDEHLVFESSQTMTDIPYGDCFTVDLRWDVTAIKEGEGAKGGGGGGSEVNFDVYIKVPFSRRCLFKSVIENGSHNQVQETYTGMVEQLRVQLADRNRMEGLNGNGPSNSNSYSNNNNGSNADDASNGNHPPTPLSPSSSSKADGTFVNTTSNIGNSNSNGQNNNNNNSSNNEKTVASRSGATDGKASVKIGGGGGGVANQKEEDVSTPPSRDGIPVVVRQGGSATAVPPKRDHGSNDVSTEMKDEAPLLSPPHPSDAGPSTHPHSQNQNQNSIISNVINSNNNSSSSTHTAAIVARVCRLREKKATAKNSRGDDSTNTANHSANTTGSGTSKLSPSSSPTIPTSSSHSYSSSSAAAAAAAASSSSHVFVSSMSSPSLSSNSTTPAAAATAVLSSLSSGFNRLVHACADTLYGGIQNRSHMTRLNIRRGLPNALHGFRSKKKEKKLSHHRNHSQSQSQGAVKGEEGAGRKAALRRRRETGKDGEEEGEGGYLEGREEEGEGREEGSSESGEGDFAEHENDGKESHHMAHHNHRTNDQKEHDSKSSARNSSKNSQGNAYTYPYPSNHSENSKDLSSSSGSSATNGNGHGTGAANQPHALIPGNANTTAAAAAANNNSNHANLNNPQQCLPKRAKFLIATLLALILIQVLSCIVATHAPRGLWSSSWPSYYQNPDPKILPAPGFPYSYSNVYGRPNAIGGEGPIGGEGDLRGTGAASSLGNHPYAQTHILNHHPGEEKSHYPASHPQPHFPSHKDGDDQRSHPNANANGDHLNRYRDELKMLHERIDMLTKLVEVSVSAQIQGIQSQAHVSGSEKYGSDESSKHEPSGATKDFQTNVMEGKREEIKGEEESVKL